MLPVAVVVWACCVVPKDYRQYVVLIAMVFAVVSFAVSAWAFRFRKLWRVRDQVRVRSRARVWEQQYSKPVKARSGRWITGVWTCLRGCVRCSPGLIVVATAMLCVLSSIYLHEAVELHDAAQTLQGRMVSEAQLKVTSPATVSMRRGSDCQYRAVLLSVTAEGMKQPSHREVLVFAEGKGCSITLSEVIAASGTLKTATFGALPLWFEMTEENQPARIRSPSLVRRMVATMLTSFFAVCQGLSEQGRILVPGVTMGVLGSDTVVTGQESSSGQASSNDTNAGNAIEEKFKNSGIVHLLAVSGGHFVLVAEFLRKLAARLRLPRFLGALMVVMGYAVLAVLMYPSDSVLRALVMGVVGVACTTFGRASQSMSVLSVCVVCSLIVRPVLATSFGFALSCAAVMGILLFSAKITKRVPRVVPRAVAAAFAVTLSAQIFTLPVQMLMTPTVPLLSIPANLCVAPFVSFSTICGLLGLLCSAVVPSVAWILVNVASVGTSVMNRCATLFGDSSASTFALPVSGTVASVSILSAEMIAYGIVVFIGRKRRVSDGEIWSGMSTDSGTLNV